MKPWPALLAALLVAGSAVGAENARLASDDRRTLERCDEAAELEKQSKWDDALSSYLTLIADAGDELIRCDASRRRWQPVKLVVLDRIAHRPELQSRYRTRFEATAERRLVEALSRNDSHALAHLAAEFRPCRASVVALQALGDIQFEQGAFADARHAWQMAAQYQTSPLLHAKVALAGLALGELGETELNAFRKQYPTARGWLAGREGLLADTFSEMLRTRNLAPHPALPPMKLIPESAPKTVKSPIALPFYWAIDPESDKPRSRVIRPRQPPFHPIIWNGHALINDGTRILAFDLKTGILVSRLDEEEPAQQWIHAETLASDGSRIYARLRGPAKSGGVITCLEQNADGAKLKWHQRWVLDATTAAGPGDGMASWDGCPLVDNGRIYCSFTRTIGTRASITLRAYSADDPLHGPIWSRPVVELSADARIRNRPLLLTRAGPNIVLSTDAGLIVAVDAANGKLAWAFEYPTRGPRGVAADLMPVPRDIAPPIAADGRVIAAPFDSGDIFELDAWSGEPFWHRPLPVETVHILGVSGRRLIVTVDGIRSGIVAIDLVTGQLISDWGSLASDRPIGRGMISGDRVFWPTPNQGLRIIRIDGSLEYPPTAFFNLPPGNVAYGDGFLVLATHEQLHILEYDLTEAAKTTPADSSEPKRQDGPFFFQADDFRDKSVAPKSLDPAWHFDLPADEMPLAITTRGLVTTSGLRKLPSGDLSDGKIPRPPINSQVAGDLLVSRVDAHTMEATSRAGVVWRSSLLVDEFSPMFLCTQDAVLVQTSAGEARLFDVHTGALRDMIPTARQLWDSQPVATRNGLIVFAVSTNRLVAIKVQSGQSAWSLETPKESPSDGSLPMPFWSGGRLWARFSTTAGSVIAAINIQTGKIDFTFPLIAERVDARAVLAQDDEIVLANGRMLRCMTRDGDTRWKLDLPEPIAWSVRSAGPGLLLVAMIAPTWAWTERLPNTHRWLAMLVDRKTGKVQSQCDLPARGTNIVTSASGDHWVVALNGGVWGFPTSEAK